MPPVEEAVIVIGPFIVCGEVGEVMLTVSCGFIMIDIGAEVFVSGLMELLSVTVAQ